MFGRLIGYVGAVTIASALATGVLAQGKPAVPDPQLMTVLIRTSVIALDHANRSGNYTVLRDLAAPSFAKANSAARLAGIFAKLRGRNLNLSPVVMFAPKLTRKPVLDKQGILRLTGYFPTKPLAVQFDLMFQPVANQWRLFGIAVDTKAAVVARAPAPKQVSTPKAPAPAKAPEMAKVSPPKAPVAPKVLATKTATSSAPPRTKSVFKLKGTNNLANLPASEIVPLPIRRPKFKPVSTQPRKPNESGAEASSPATTQSQKRRPAKKPGSSWLPWE